jgi:hypothetical protein
MADETIKKLLEESSFSFIGTVEQYGAATMSNLSIDDHTAVVNVDHVLSAPAAFAQMEGHRVTVQLARDADPPPVGQALALFTQGLAFGDSVAVTEVGRLPVEDVEPYATQAVQAGKAAGAFDAIRVDMHRERLQRHAAESDAVVVGRVVKVEKALPHSGAEHDPDWWRATIDVHHVERGNVKVGPVEVVYPNSLDVRWYAVPKPKPGAEAVWMLHATQGDLRAVAPFQIVHLDDSQPVDKLAAMREPTGKPGEKP